MTAATADRVAARADGVFLYARIVSRTLEELDRLDGVLPTTALEAFTNDLQARFGAEQQRVDDLLAALAWGEGSGLTRRAWPPVADALATWKRSYGDDDVAWVLGHVGWHIIEAEDDGQAVYRLGHQALVDHYRARLNVMEAQGRIFEALSDGKQGSRWFDCDRYLWRHLANHAAQAGCLDALIRDPGYLAVADPSRLVTALPSVGGARRFADVYNRIADRLIEQRPLDRLSLIHLAAQMDAPDLASGLVPPVPTRWLCRWARVSPSAPYRIIGSHSAEVMSVSFGMMEGRAVVVSGSDDRTVRLWDARTGNLIGNPLEGHTDKVNAVGLGPVEGRMVVVSGSDDHTIRIWDARTGDLIGEPLEGHTDRVNAAVLGAIDDRAIVISGSDDQSLRLWDAYTGEPIRYLIEERKEAVTAVGFGVIGGRPVVASGNQSATIHLWDARTGAPMGKPLEGAFGYVQAIAVGEADRHAVIVSGGGIGTFVFGTPAQANRSANCFRGIATG